MGEQEFSKKGIVALASTIILLVVAILMLPQAESTLYTNSAYAGSSAYGTYGTYGLSTYQPYGFTSRMPVLIGGESRPEGYGLVRQGPAYPLNPNSFRENNDFLGHRSNWDGRSAFYSGFTGRTRLPPRMREPNPLYNPQHVTVRYAPARLGIPENTGYGPWYKG